MTTESLAGQITHFSISFTTIVCGRCGIPFAVPQNYYDKLKETHESWCCPNGHKRHFTLESEAERLANKLRVKENELAQTTARNIQLDNQLTKMKNDLAKGKCPCCNKVYKHLAAHMKNKHPKGI